MAFDGIVTKAIASELQQLSGARIDKIFQPNKNNIIFEPKPAIATRYGVSCFNISGDVSLMMSIKVASEKAAKN